MAEIGNTLLGELTFSQFDLPVMNLKLLENQLEVVKVVLIRWTEDQDIIEEN